MTAHADQIRIPDRFQDIALVVLWNIARGGVTLWDPSDGVNMTEVVLADGKPDWDELAYDRKILEEFVDWVGTRATKRTSPMRGAIEAFLLERDQPKVVGIRSHNA